jgi:hypothetical protein
MWGTRSDERGPGVTCIACGDEIPRSKAREYDKHGDRWDRDGKEFEYVCKPCDRDLCHQPRGDLEALVTDIERGSGDLSQEQFLAQYVARTEQESVEER